MALNKDFKEFIELLNSNKVKYLVVGGYAVAFHGHPRYTKDLDIWVWIEKNNSIAIEKSLQEFGFSALDIKADDFLEPGYVIQLGTPPSRIDIITQASGVDFEECYRKKNVLDIDGTIVPFLDIVNLVKNKTATGRLPDLADIEKLQTDPE